MAKTTLETMKELGDGCAGCGCLITVIGAMMMGLGLLTMLLL